MDFLRDALIADRDIGVEGYERRVLWYAEAYENHEDLEGELTFALTMIGPNYDLSTMIKDIRDLIGR